MNKNKNTLPSLTYHACNHFRQREYNEDTGSSAAIRSGAAVLAADTYPKVRHCMKIVVMTSPKLIAPILRRIFGVRKRS